MMFLYGHVRRRAAETIHSYTNLYTWHFFTTDLPVLFLFTDVER